MDRRVLVCGGSGLVGSALMNSLWSRSYDVVGTCYSNAHDGMLSMEMEHVQSIQDVLTHVMPNDIYVASYISDVDRCETDGYARQVNVGGLKDLVGIAKKINARVIFFSSSYVFDGDKSLPYNVWDIPAPIQQYGIQKLMGESLVLSSDCRNIVVRTVGVYGEEDKRKNFAYSVIDSILQHKKFYADFAQIVNPILSESLAEATVNMAAGGYEGLLHIGGSEVVSKFDWAYDIAKRFGLDAELVIPAKTTPKAARPRNGSLKNNISFTSDYNKDLDRFYAAN